MGREVVSAVGNLYSVLGVSPDASQETIIHAYRRHARTSHPDVRPHDPEAALRFRMLTDAYHVLTDPVRRAKYDRGQRTDAASRVSRAVGDDRPSNDRLARPDASPTGRPNSSNVFLLAGSPRSRPALWAGPVQVEGVTRDTSVRFQWASGHCDLHAMAALLFDRWSK